LQTSKSWVVPAMVIACAALAAPSPATAARSAHPAADRDHDRLPDRWERRHRLSTVRKSGAGDPDHDRLSNRREFKLKTNPRRADTDRDGLRDRAEVRRYHTNPRRADTDRDGFNDGVEVKAGTNPRDPRSHPSGPPPAPAPSPGAGGFPNPATTGVPAGWTPAQTRTSELRITQPGAVVQDVLLQNADIIVAAPNVTIRRVKLQGGSINNFQGPVCSNGLTVEDTSIEPPPGQDYSTESEGVIGYGGYTARRVEIWRRAEGFRVSGTPDCGAVRIEDSFAKIAIPPGRCDLHSDGIQGYYGNALAVSNVTIDFNEAACGTAPFFVPSDQGNTSATVDRLLVSGGGYPFRMGVPGTVSGLKIVNNSWEYGPISVTCSRISSWDASIVTITPDYQVASTVRAQPCNSNGT
jgi:hypothetical protein